MDGCPWDVTDSTWEFWLQFWGRCIVSCMLTFEDLFTDNNYLMFAKGSEPELLQGNTRQEKSKQGDVI